MGLRKLLTFALICIAAHCEEAVKEHEACAKLPPAAKFFCNKHAANFIRRLASPSRGNASDVPLAKAPISMLSLCMDLRCVCREFTGVASDGCVYKNQQVKKAVRKEIRMLTRDERKRFFDAMVELRNQNLFDRYFEIHTIASGPIDSNAHFGPGFFPWHRELLKRFELELRRIDPGVAIPYWDNRIESRLGLEASKIARSVLFSAELMGRTIYGTNERIRDGRFVGWGVRDKGLVTRSLGSSVFMPMNDAAYSDGIALNVDYFLGYALGWQLDTCPKQVGNVHSSFLFPEWSHGQGHDFVGGFMSDLTRSSADPIFFLHHAFIDSWFEEYRQRRQTRQERETQYATILGCVPTVHYSDQRLTMMEERSIMNALSNDYTDNLYEYADAPTCSFGNTDCGSEFLFCNTATFKCVSKIAMNQQCADFAQFDSCYNGQCTNGVCRPTAQTTSPTPRTTTTTTRAPPVTTTRAATTTTTRRPPPTTTTSAQPDECKNCDVFEDPRCYNCESWARDGECIKNPDYMLLNCPLYCGSCDRYFCAKRFPWYRCV